MTKEEIISALRYERDTLYDAKGYDYSGAEAIREAIKLIAKNPDKPTSCLITENPDKLTSCKKVNICGVTHNVIEFEDQFNVDTHFGQIDYLKCEIKINSNMSDESKKESLCHEMVHGILVHLGYSEQSQDEQFVQALANAIYQGFDIKEI